MAISLQTQMQTSSLGLSSDSSAASGSSGGDNPLQQIMMLIIEQVLKALQDKLGNKDGGKAPGGADSASGPGGAGGNQGGSGPEGALQRFAELFKGLSEALDKSLNDQKANDFAQKLANALGTDAKTLDKLDVMRFDEMVEIRAEARSFLHHQVRSMVGSLAQVGTGKWHPLEMRRALEARDRARCGPVCPPDGLYLVEVLY